MSNTVVITSIYSEFEGTRQFRKSCAEVDLPLYNAFKGERFTGNGDVIKMIYDALCELKKQYKFAIYADGADSYFVKPFTPPENYILYQGEKACWPIESVKYFYAPGRTPWRFLNGGGYCGEIDLLIRYFEKFNLDKFQGSITGQLEQHIAYLLAQRSGFPIQIDEQCEYFQSIAFREENDFGIIKATEMRTQIANTLTGTKACLFHGNGRTPMEWIYKLYE